MPQMAPLWWELLFTMFVTSFMLMIMIMYFNKMMKSKKIKTIIITTKQKQWKW
uniref:ATP synthase F0 subunit 8 n=1 Tax=Leptocorisa costalis TaxID=2899124 RepID=A0A8T9EH35_9HEMI|nr:ATP synthase F0 subunit 8 [Leptocorisa costalis]UNA68827.1 ATP synthase F0 subunit 8 [Leptocorisa costalis]